MLRRRLGTIGTADLLRRLRGRDGLVALIGSWDDGREVVAYEPSRTLGADEDPFDLPLDVVSGRSPHDEDGAVEAGEVPSFAPAWLGWWGYRLGHRLEATGPQPSRPNPLPDARLARYDTVLRRIDGVWWFESVAGPLEAEARLEDVRRVVARSAPPPASYDLSDFAARPDGDAHRAAVARTIAHIRAGDLFQANVCLRLEAAFDGDPLELFLAGIDALRPAYAAFVADEGRAVVSLSPELYLRRRGRHVLSSPIKGTAPSSADPAALAASVKDRAENVMIVDLVRNDLGRVAVPGTVTVEAAAVPRAHTGVWHLVSDVTATLREGVTDADLLRASFPPGSVTGAPKIRAMQVIGEVEATSREVYTGAVGYVGAAGLEANVAIRTFEVDHDRIWLGVGGGVVAPSDPDAELAECLTKAAPLLRAVGGRLAEVSSRPVTPVETRTRPAPARRPSAVETRPDHTAGIFDTLLVRDGAAVDAAGHVRRLARSAAEVYGVALDVDALVARVHGRASTSRGSHRLRLAVRPGAEVEVTTVAAPAVPDGPWTLDPVVVPDGLGEHKWIDRSLLDALPGAPWTPDRDPLLVDGDGCVLETGRGNVVAVFDDGVHTPSLDGRLLPGVTRAELLARLRARRVPVFERPMTLDELAGADAVVVTNAIGRLRPVRTITGVAAWAPDRTTVWLRELLAGPLTPPPVDDPRGSGVGTGAHVVLIDNQDSFVYNLAQYVTELGATASVVRNDAVGTAELRAMREVGDLTHLVISPGPGAPGDAGVSVDAVRVLGETTPVLGVCLGHQAIGEAYGARVVRAARPVHGVPSIVHHDGAGVFAGIPGPVVAARYHSLVVDDLPADVEVTARSVDGTLMGVRHRTHPVEGVQFHPESVLTPLGHALLARFLRPAADRSGLLA
ncbi:para-aminobenzoate synthetase/4-amino-4-deoxychorismate lyase [Mumia flava]|uniref:Para-aminobenzoate synthetase/4-amino-4-deoxychorismate lyase n=1 Tax=Mumia flava TaxID=1348852 RepID=A0A2M9BHM1_9ACTN|nr:aminodeoxychorismate synthase component I [Mumia flava]PJJ57441.1 para-aminobenzoate synthetase/4-amino-4-deoxychorismate lyase [Mumia flava]